MSEKIQLEVVGTGAEQFKKQLFDIGREGTRVAQQLRQEFRKGIIAGGNSTNLGREARIAMNSFRHAERERARINKEIEKEIQANRRATAAEAKRAEKEVAAVTAARAQVARAQRLSEAAAARVAAQQIIAAKRAQAAADARFVREEINRAAGLRRARVREAREAAREEAQAKREAAQAKAMGSSGARLLMGAAAIISVRQLAGGFVELSDSMENARNRMRNVSASEGEMNTTMEVLKKTALDSRTEFDLTTRTYARLKNATSQLHLSTAANIEMTNTLTKAISVSGATGEEAHATLIQLSQAMASNRLSADEFRSVAEQLPIILDLLSDSTGKARTQLKKMGEDGQLTTAVVSLAILNGQKKIADMFAKTNPTIAQSWTNVGTQARFALDEFNRATGTSKTVVDALKWIGNNMSTVTFAAKTLGYIVGVVLVGQVGSAAVALRALALANPWTAAILGFTVLISTVREYRNEILNTIGIEHEWAVGRGWVKRDSVTVEEKDPVTGKWVAKDRDFDRNKADRYRHNLEESRRQMHEEAQADARKALMDRLRKQQEIDLKNSKKNKRGRRPPTFEDAVSSLEQDVAEGTLTNRARAQMEAIMQVQDKLNGSLREGDVGYKHLSASQQEYVVNLLDSKKKQQDTIATQQALFKLEMDRLDALVAFRKEWKLFAAEYEQDQRRLQRDIKVGVKQTNLFPKLTSDTDFSRAELQVKLGQKSGVFNQSEAQTARNLIEMQRPNITAPRKQFLEELEGMGKFKQDVDSIFGPDGSIATGFSSAIAHSITFHNSFKKSIHDLGKSIQQEILQTLIQGLIRMAILGAMGGGKATIPIPGVGLPASTGTGRAVGGYTGDGPRTGIAGYNHYGEFVVNRQGTQQNRDVLETINKGGNVSSMGGARLQVTVINQHGGVEHEVQQMSPNQVYVIAKRAVKDHADKAVASAMSDANNPFMKRLGATTNARIQR